MTPEAIAATVVIPWNIDRSKLPGGLPLRKWLNECDEAALRQAIVNAIREANKKIKEGKRSKARKTKGKK